MAPTSTTGQSLEAGRPIVFRNGIVLTMDSQRTVLHGGDVLIVDGRIAAVGVGLQAPADALEIDAAGGIVMPGMIDTHRHMWQTAMRGYGADWSLTQYFVWYYLQHGAHFRPEDIAAGNLLSAIESLEAGVTTTVDWSHGLRSVDHGEAALDALASVPGRFVLAYGNLAQAPWEWAKSDAFRAFVDRRFSGSRDRLDIQMAFDVTGDEAFPERGAFEVARELDLIVTTHAGVWGATNDNGIRLIHDHGFANDRVVYVHAATLSDDSYHRIAASGGSVSIATESEQSCGQGYPPTWKLREFGIPISMSMDTSVWFSADLFTAMRTTVGADRSREHLEAHVLGNTVTQLQMRCSEAVEWSTLGGAAAIGRANDLGSLEAGRVADVILIKNDASPAMFPILNPYGHVVMQAQRSDVHTVVVGGNIVKHEHRLIGIDLQRAKDAVADTVDHLRSSIGEDVWNAGMFPDVPERSAKENPYQYTKR